MAAAEKISVVLSTCPPDAAEQLAGHLVEERLAAAVNIVPQVTSFYWWKGQVQREGESLLVMKCPVGKVDELTGRLRAVHPYEVPQIVAVDVSGGNSDYARWVYESTEG